MKTTKLLLLLTVLNTSAFSAPFNFSSAAEGQQKLKALFDISTEPNSKDLIGWQSGRCYSNEATDNLYGVLLIGLPIKTPDGSVELEKVFSMTNIGGRPEAFDQLSVNVRGMIESSLTDENLLSQMKPMSISNQAIHGGLVATPDFLESEYAIKKYQDMYIIHGQQGNFSEWCYVFKKVK